MTAAIFCYSRAGIETAKRVKSLLPDAHAALYTLARFSEPGFLPIEKRVYGLEFSQKDALIFIGAAGIAVREIAPFVRDKKTDPAVLCIDERSNFVIPLLSGHIGGANRLAIALADALGAAAAITTATDVNGKFAVDEFAARTGCAISDMRLAKAFAAEILERCVPLQSAFRVASPLPGGVVFGNEGDLGLYIGCDKKAPLQRRCAWSRKSCASASAAAEARRRTPSKRPSGRSLTETFSIFARSAAFFRSR